MRNIFLIFRRDYLGYVKAWGFWLSIASLPIFLAVGMLVGGFVAQSSPVRYYAVLEEGTRVSSAIAGQFERDDREAAEAARRIAESMNVALPEMDKAIADARATRKFVEVPVPARSIEALRPYLQGDKLVSGPEGEKPLFAVFVAAPGSKDVEYWSEDVSVTSLRFTASAALKHTARSEAMAGAGLPTGFIDTVDDAAGKVLERRIRKEEAGKDDAEVTMADRAPALVSVGIAYILWLMIFSLIQYLLMGTIEERSNKIFDTLLTSVQLPQLLAGKLLAVFAVTMTMMLCWSLFSMVGSITLAMQSPDAWSAVKPFTDALLNPGLIIPALISFVLGYIMYGALFMALGALCDTIQEAQTLISPLMLLLMLPMLAIVIAVGDPGSPVVAGMSWVPFFTPFVMIMRIPQNPPLWEVLCQIGLMMLTTMVIVWIAAKVYRAGAVNGATAGDAGKALKRMIGLKPKAG